MKHEKYMRLALEEAKKAYSESEIPVGAVIVRNEEVIACAYNRKNGENSVTKHAELIAIENASQNNKNWRLNDCILYVTLEPCPMCASAIQQARIASVVYGTPSKDEINHQIVDKIFSHVNANDAVTLIGPVLQEQSEKLLTSFFKNRRNSEK